jgi:acyl dehydratase
MSTVLASPGFWLGRADAGVDATRVVHGEQGFELHAPLRTGATLEGTTHLVSLVDKGPAVGALLYQRREVRDVATGELVCVLTMTSVLRGEGGFGEPRGTPPSPTRVEVPERRPDASADAQTTSQSALLFRLQGDLNPLHVEPEVARRAGYQQPILHGLCTFGAVGLALTTSWCGDDLDRLVAMRARFRAPVYPGDKIRTESWREGDDVVFRATVMERNQIVVDRGRARLRAPSPSAGSEPCER